jgi:hypothetical protein
LKKRDGGDAASGCADGGAPGAKAEQRLANKLFAREGATSGAVGHAVGYCAADFASTGRRVGGAATRLGAKRHGGGGVRPQ